MHWDFGHVSCQNVCTENSSNPALAKCDMLFTLYYCQRLVMPVCKSKAAAKWPFPLPICKLYIALSLFVAYCDSGSGRCLEMKAMRSVVVTIATGFAVGADGSSTMYTRCTRLASIMSIARDTGVSAPHVIRGTCTHSWRASVGQFAGCVPLQQCCMDNRASNRHGCRAVPLTAKSSRQHAQQTMLEIEINTICPLSIERCYGCHADI